MSNAFIDHLNSFTESDWLTAIDELLPSIHEVDRNAVQIWFRFYPLSLHRYLQSVDRNEAIRGLALQGDFELKDQIDTSHHFFYGHRYWPTAKCKLEKLLSEPPTGAPAGASPRGVAKSAGGQNGKKGTGSENSTLADLIKDLACRVAKKHNVDRSLVNGIAAVALMTLNQVGEELFRAAPGQVDDPTGLMKKSPDSIVAERAKDDSQGVFGFLKTVDKKFSVTFAASNYSGKFPVINEEEVVSAAQKDRSRNWQSLDERCWEGPVPVECTAASCGTCWVGVLGGQEKLNEVGRRERRQMKVFGYNQPEDDKPFLRLACQTRATGNVTIVIPPWNGVFGKKVYGNVEEVELEPATTSAKQLREVVKSATSGE
ncbi:MAG: (2Fe-2S)-binding protein [Acidobacteria bacterium]|nr:(2Fe-2S)-binding protein [Acidobacteriota bacterium]